MSWNEEKVEKLNEFTKQCHIKGFKLYISNNISLILSIELPEICTFLLLIRKFT